MPRGGVGARFWLVSSLAHSPARFPRCALTARRSLNIIWSPATQFWSVTDSLYFCMVLVSTVGYGANLTPSTAWSRLFSIYFTMAGLLIFGAVSDAAVIVGSYCYDWIDAKWTTYQKSRTAQRNHARMDSDALKINSDELNLFTQCLTLFASFLVINYVRTATLAHPRVDHCHEPGKAASHHWHLPLTQPCATAVFAGERSHICRP